VRLKMTLPKIDKIDLKQSENVKEIPKEILLKERKNNPLIGDVKTGRFKEEDYDYMNNLYKLLMDVDYSKKFINVIKYYYPKKYYELIKYISGVVKRNGKINILKFIYNQLIQDSSLRLFYPPYLQEYITINGLDTLYKVIKFLFISFNKKVEDHIIINSKEQIKKDENDNYPYFKDIQSDKKYFDPTSLSSIAAHKYYNKSIHNRK